MKKLSKISYIIKMILFIIHFYFVFISIHNILDTKVFGIIFLLLYIAFILTNILELLSKKERYKNDLIYNLMQIGIISYFLIIAIKSSVMKIYVTNLTISYFRINFIILSLLIIFIFIYNYLQFRNSSK